MMRPGPRVSVIVATYMWPEALDAVLRALVDQSQPPQEVVIADDGSGEETGAVVERWRGHLELQHVWHPDEGFRRARILNLAALAARGDYLAFLDGDCLPRRDFVRAVERAAIAGWFLASKRLNLSTRLTRRVLEESLPVWRWSALRWAVAAPRELLTGGYQANRPGLLLPLRDRRRPWRPDQPDFSPPYDAYGCVFGVSRDDLAGVNGFDMRFEGWGGEDVDIAARLRRAGLRCGWPGPDATVLHLWHDRSGQARPNAPLTRETEAGANIEAVEGLRELAAEAPVA